MAVSSGTYTIGAAGDYATVTAAAADIAATLTGNLTFEHLNEETAIGTIITFTTNTNSYLLKFTTYSGAEHNGGAYGNGARIAMSTYDGIDFSMSNNTVSHIEISKIAINANTTGSYGLKITQANTAIVNRVIVNGASTAYNGIELNNSVITTTLRNSIVTGFGASGSDRGIRINNSVSGRTTNIYNNTVAKCYYGIWRSNTSGGGTINLKNNLLQGNTTDFVDAGAGFGTTAYNISEDATSPNTAYRNVNAHDATSSFTDYANDDYRLTGSGTDDATLDDGEDLSGTFTDDIIGTTRSTWWIGAFEYVAAGGGDLSINVWDCAKQESLLV